MLSFSRTCLLSDNQLVNFVARHAVWYGRMRSPFSKNAFHCCQWYGVALEDLWVVSPAYIFKAVEAPYDINQICTVRSILELVFIRSGYLEFSDMSNSTCISACEIEAFISFFVLVKFYSLIVCYMCVPCVRFL